MGKSIAAVMTAIAVAALIIFSVSAEVKKLICSWQKAEAQAMAVIDGKK